MKIKNTDEIFLFIFLTYLLSWSIWGVGYSFYAVNYNFSSFAFIIFIGSCMPSFMGIILTSWFHKRKWVKEFFSRLSILKNHRIYLVVGIIAITFYVFSTFIIAKIIGFNERLKIDFLTIFSNFISILLIGGPIAEELGWRGFLLDKVHSKCNVCISSIIVGTIWALWHTPLFFMPGSSQYSCPILLFILNSIFITIIISLLLIEIIFSFLKKRI